MRVGMKCRSKTFVFPSGEKDLVFAFADQARHSKENFDDFVQQKVKMIYRGPQMPSLTTI